jgi:hypothetical protein
MRSSTSPHAFPDAAARRRAVALWTGSLAGPVVWLVLLETNYVLSYVACETRQTWFLYVAVVAAVALVGGAGAWAWRAGAGPLEDREPLTPPLSSETREVRVRWMARFAAATSIWFIIVILSMAVPVVVLKTCQ